MKWGESGVEIAAPPYIGDTVGYTPQVVSRMAHSWEGLSRDRDCRRAIRRGGGME